MTALLPALVMAFAAFCLWLTVRIINRRERWAKWTLATALGLPFLYLLSFGPACWITSRLNFRGETIPRAYAPIMQVWGNSRNPFAAPIRWYAALGSAPGWDFRTYSTTWQDRDGSNWWGIRCQWCDKLVFDRPPDKFVRMSQPVNKK